METARISIENFKGIKRLELDVKPFTILIGPQSVGKSVTAKLIFYFQSAIWEVLSVAINESECTLESRLLERFGKLLSEPTRTEGRSSIRYAIGEYQIVLTHQGEPDSSWRINLPEPLKDRFSKIRQELSEVKKPRTEDDLRNSSLLRVQVRDQYVKWVEDKFGPELASVPRFIPAGRSFYAQVEKDAVSFFESAAIDPFVGSFGQYLARVKDMPFTRMARPKVDKVQDQLASDLAESLLSGKYKREGQRDYISVQDGRKIPAALWSSGQQESLPLVFILQRYSEGHLKSRTGTTLFIEEPEAHLFPTSQRKIVELISLAFNASDGALNLFVTTHSPYVLSTINVLLKANQVSEANQLNSAKRARISKVVPELEQLKVDLLGVYYMDQTSCTSIIDSETGLIDGRAIDDVSSELAEQFDALVESQ